MVEGRNGTPGLLFFVCLVTAGGHRDDPNPEATGVQFASGSARKSPPPGFVGQGSMLAQLLLNGFVDGCLIALMALSFSLIYSTTRVFHIAHGGVFAAAGYVFYGSRVLLDWSIPVSCAVTVVAISLLGVALDQLFYAPLTKKNASSLVLFLTSLGLYIAVTNLLALVFGADPKLLKLGGGAPISIGSLLLAPAQLVQVLATGPILLVVVWTLKSSGFGRSLRALRDDPLLATAMGLPVTSLRRGVFLIGSGLAAVAAILFAFDIAVTAHRGLTRVLEAAAALIIGGVRSFWGAIVGGLVLGLAQGAIQWRLPSRWSEAVTYILLILVLLLRPWGLVGDAPQRPQ